LTHWISPNSGATNESGFTALPGGTREDGFGNFIAIGLGGYFWTSTGLSASNNINALVRILLNTKPRISRVGFPKVYGPSLHCVKD
jgi:uncharacterized protein (TIGR02145 family)